MPELSPSFEPLLPFDGQGPFGSADDFFETLGGIPDRIDPLEVEPTPGQKDQPSPDLQHEQSGLGGEA